MKKWICQSCGTVARAHPSAVNDSTQMCIRQNCGSIMTISGPPKLARQGANNSGPPILKRKKPVPGLCPICLGHDCDDPACFKSRGV